jgi:hypothetical protein
MPTEGQNEQGQTPPEGETPPAPTFDEWIKGQDATVSGLIGEHTRGLKSALDAERQQRREFERQLREATGKVAEGSEARKKLDELTAGLTARERQSEFYESAHAAGVTNLRLAWLAAQADESVLDRHGAVDMEKLKKAYPELFGVRPAGKAPAGNAGAGTGSEPPKSKGMNDFIRRSAGRQ